MYASDYGYTKDLSICSKDLTSQREVDCGESWIKTQDAQWLINPYSKSNNASWRFSYYGTVIFSGGLHNSFYVCPVLYLDPKLGIESGDDGSSDYPYRIVVE